MSDNNLINKGLTFYQLDADKQLVLDPDNVFWGIMRRQDDGEVFIPRSLLTLYEKKKDRLDAEMDDFRFSANLTAVYINPTNECNASCAYCYIPAHIRRDGAKMSEEQLDLILKKIIRYFRHSSSSTILTTRKKPVIVFHASEPLLVKETVFGAIARFSKELRFGIQTNATLLERKDADFLKKYRVGVGISLDSYDKAINRRQRPARGKDGNFEKALQAIKWFDGYPGLNVITTITKLNVTQLPGILDFLHAMKVGCILMNPVRLTQPGARKIKPDERQMTKYFIMAVDRAIELSKNSRRRIIIGNFSNAILAVVAPNARRLMCDISPCGGGRCFLTITASGEMIPCGEFIGLKGFSGGNIFGDEIENAMSSKPFEEIRSRFVEKIAECRDCAVRNICGAPCPAELHALGNMYQPSAFCEFYKEIINHAFKVIAEGNEKYCFRDAAEKNFRFEYRLA